MQSAQIAVLGLVAVVAFIAGEYHNAQVAGPIDAGSKLVLETLTAKVEMGKVRELDGIRRNARGLGRRASQAQLGRSGLPWSPGSIAAAGGHALQRCTQRMWCWIPSLPLRAVQSLHLCQFIWVV